MAIIPGAPGSTSALLDRKKSKQTKMLYLLVFIVLATVAFYFLFNKAPSIVSAPSIALPSAEESTSYDLATGLKAFDLDLTVINDSKFKSLLLHGEFPVVVGQQGRDNPFAPF